MTESNEKLRLLMSGGGFRAMIGNIGAILYLEQAGIWKQVTEVVSVSGGSSTNAALVAVGMEGDDDVTRLRIFYKRLLRSRGMPWASWRSALYLALIVVVVTAAIAIPVLGSGLVGPLATRPLLGIVGGVIMFPVMLQFGRRALSLYTRESIEVPLGIRGLTLAARHRPTAPRQHIFCASGLASGAPYYFWVGGAHFLGAGRDADSGTAHHANQRWGAAVDPTRKPNYTFGDVVYASSALPMMVGPLSPAAVDSQEDGVFLNSAERLIDGGASGVFGQQILDPFWKPPGGEPHRSAAGQAHPVIAVDAMRGARAGGQAGRLAANWLSGIGLLIRWVKIGGDAIYVNDLLDCEDTAVIRLCEPDLPRRGWQPPNSAKWTAAWAEIKRDRSKERALEGLEGRVGRLRADASRLGLFNLNESTGVQAMTTGFVVSYLTLKPVIDLDELEVALATADRHFFGEKLPDHTMSKCWADTIRCSEGQCCEREKCCAGETCCGGEKCCKDAT